MKKFTLCTLSLCTFISANAIAAPKLNVKKNVLFIAVDDLKPLLGCYGDGIAKTPNIDKLAKNGTIFTSAYCQQAVSAATRASLLTGWCPDRTKVWDLKTKIRAKNPNVITLPQYFKANGYTVAGIGKIYDPREVDKQEDAASWSVDYISYEKFINSSFEQPAMAQYQSKEVRNLYEKYKAEAMAQGLTKNNQITAFVQKRIKPTTECADIPDDAYSDGAIASGAVDFIKNYTAEKPLFMAVGFKKPHLPFCAPQKYWNMYDEGSLPLATYQKRAANSPAFAYHNCGELQMYSDIPSIISFSDIDNVIIPDSKARELIHGYYACVSYMDAQLGKVLDALKKKGMESNTIIVFWGDHGWHLGDHGLWNKHTNFEQATRVPFIIVDPTSRARKIDYPVEFLSIYPTLCSLAGIPIPQGLDGENLENIMKGKTCDIKPYAASQYPRVGKMGYTLRDKRYRYTIWVDWKNRRLNANTVLAEELYDYQADPNETVNQIDNPSYAHAKKQMQAYWADYKTRRMK